MTREQLDTLMKRTKEAVNLSFCEMSQVQRQDLVSIVLSKTYNYQPSEQYPDPVPCIEFLKKVARRQAYKKENHIFEREQIVSDNELEETKEELDLEEDEASRYSNYYQFVSLDALEDDDDSNAWEPVDKALNAEQGMIAEEDRRNDHIEAYRNSDVFPLMLKAALAHVAAGGTFKSFAESMGLSAMTLMNRFQKIVQKDADQKNPIIPGLSIDINVKQTGRASTKPAKRISNVQEQYTLFA